MSDESKSAELRVYSDIELITRFLNRQLDPATDAHVRKLIEEDDRYHKPVTRLRRGDGSSYTDYHIYVCRSWRRTCGFRQQFKVY